MESFEVIIVGAGISGLCAAQTFLAIDSSLSLLLIDSRQTLGGVWATEQLYPGLRTNNLQGLYEFSNFSLVDAGVGVKPRGQISGTALHSYLEKYAARFDLTKRIRLSTEVLRAVEQGDVLGGNAGWELHLRSTDHQSAGTSARIACQKLVIATGTSAVPYIPSFKGLQSFDKPILHSAELGRRALSLINDDKIRNVTVLGGSKSAHDAVYMFSMAGKRVNWIVHDKTHGRGAVPMGKPFSQMGPLKIWVEGLLMYRPLTWFGAAPWSDGDGFGGIRWLLHRTRYGNEVVKGYFQGMSDDMQKQSGILDDEKTKVLLPGATMMWYGTEANSLNYDTDFYSLIREGKVLVTLGNIEQLGVDGRIYLGEKAHVDTDVLILATGYDFSATVPLEPAAKRLGWGCPVDSAEDDVYPHIDKRSDMELFSRFPLLRTSPVKPERLPSLSPWRLWRFLAPPSQVNSGPNRNLIFLNAVVSLQTCIKAELTSLWAYAYLYDRLAVPPPTEQAVEREVSLWTRFGKWRAPYGMQGKFADFFFDAMPYYDLLLRDLGLRSWRKGWGWVGEIFGGWYVLEDYKGVVQEWKALQRPSSSTSY